MKTLTRLSLLGLFSLIFGQYAQGQVTTTGGQTAQQLAEILAGPNITVTNATLTGGGTASGSFAGGTNSLGFDSGVILSSGNINEAPGPNGAANTGANLGEPGTAQMTALAGVNTFDAITLEFDFEVQSSFIQFNYVFASEEYPEYAPPNNTGYNDVFAFYISGPGITGEENIALVPATTNPVSINNINAITNNQYYVDNTGGADVEFDAFTTVLQAERGNLTECQTYHLKLVICDAGDGIYSSAVFLQENSLVQGLVNVETTTVQGNDIALEGCIPASFTFSYNDISNQDRIINYIVGGTAVNGVDYAFLDSSMTIVAGDTSATIFVDAFSDGITEGQESVYIIYQPAPCAPYDTAYLYIDDAQPIEFTLDETNLDCYNDFSGEIQVNATGGFPPYTYEVTDPNNNTYDTQSNPITGLEAGTYVVQVYDSYGCQAEALVIGGIFDADTTFLPDVPNGTVTTYDAPLAISGFNPGQTITDVSQIQQICLTMEHSYLGDLEIAVEAPSGEIIVLKQQNGGGSCDLGEPFASAPVDGQNSNLTDPGIGYEYCFNASPIYGTMVGESNNFTHTIPASIGGTYTDNYLPAGSYTPFENFSGLVGADMNGTWIVHVTDQFNLDNGYIFNWYISLIGDMPDTTVTLTQPLEIITTGFVTDATCGGSDGSINIDIQNAAAPYTVLWSNGATTEDISGVPAGTYTVTVTDANGCQSIETFLVNNIGSLSITSTSTPTSCFGGSDGTIDITPSGGTTPYTFSWDSGQTTEDISGLTAGTYTVTMTDQQGCIISEIVTVNDAPEVVINLVNLANEECNTDNGSIDIDVAGGTGSYGYQWSNGSTTQDISGLSSGTYQIDVVDGNGCTATASYNIINDVSNCSAFCFIEVEANVLTDETCGQGNGAIDINVLNAVAPVSYSWSNGATTEDITGLTAGSYTVVATDANNCSEVMTFTIVNDAGNLLISSASVGEENCGNTNGSIDITVTGGAMPYSYSWDSGQTTEDISGLSAGTYVVTITDGNGCQTTGSYTVNNNAGTLAATAVISEEVCTAQNGWINQTVTGGNGVLTYSWSSGQTTQDINLLSAGTYTCTITDETGCYIVQDYQVTQSTGDISLVGSNITNEVCGNSQGAVNITVTGNNLSFLWSNGATTEDLTGVPAGNYSCTITNLQGCTYTTPTYSVINASGTLVVSTQVITDEICNNANGAINMSVTGGTQPYTFSWSNGSTNEDLVGLTAGSYTLTVTDANGCTESHTMTVGSSSGTLAIQNAIVTDEVCGDGAGSIDLIVVGGANPISYSWDSGQTTEDITGLSAGTYTVTVTDNNGCTAVQTYTINNQAQSLSYVETITNEICSNGQGSIGLAVTGGQAPYTYAWSNGGTTATITGLSAGTFSCAITDDNGCQITTATFTVGNTPNGISASTVVTDATCSNNGSIDLTVVGGANPLTFLWSNAETTEDITNLAAGTYTYTVTDNNGCQVNGSADVIQTNGNITYTFTTTSEICGNGAGAIDLTVSGGATPYTFAWSNGPTTEDQTGLSAGSYTCTITDNNGCSIVTSAIPVTNLPGTLNISNVITTDETCSNGLGSIDINVSGGATPYTFAWSNAETTEDISNLSSGTYTVTVTDNNGCQAVAQAVVGSSPGAMAITQPIVNDEDCGQANGSIDITITGQQNPMTFVWSNGATTEDISGLTAGSYTVTATDANGCTVVETYTIVDNGSSLAISNSTVSDEYCGSGSGSISIAISGGSAPYTYAWSNGGTTNMISNLSAGTYSVTVTDAGGCTVNGSYTVNNNAGNLAVTGVVTDENCGDGAGAIDVTTTGGNAPLSFLWDSGQTTEDLSGLSAGTYNLVVTDQYGCTANYGGTVANITGGLGVTIDLVTDENCGQADGAIDVTTTGAGIISTTWDSGQTTEDISGLTAGTYTITVSTASCSVSASATVVNQTGSLAITFTNVGDENCGNGVGFIDIDVAGVGPFTYAWSDGQTTQDAIGLSAGTYTVTVTDDNGCELSQDFTVNNTNNTNMVATGTPTDIFCAADDGSINLLVTGGVGPFTYSWDNGATTEDIDNLAPGTYSVIVTDASSCQATTTVTVGGTQQSNLGFTNLNITDEDCGQQDGQIVYFTGGTADDYYLDGVNLGGFTADNLSAGTYLAAITDNQGCYVDTIVTVGSTGTFTVTEVTTDENCGASDGAIDITVTGGANHTFLWSNGATTEDVTGLAAGNYSVDVTDDQGCTVTVFATVANQTGAFALTSQTVVDEDCSNGQGSIDIDVTGTGPFTYAWDSGQTTEDISGLTAGTYTVIITDVGASCSMTETFTVNNSTTFNVDIAVTEEFCTSADGAIDLTVTGGVAPYTYSWSNGATTEDVSNLTTGSYDVTITDASFCSTTLTINVGQGSSGLQLINFVIGNEYCGQANGDINFNSGGTADDYYIDGQLLTVSHAYNLTAGTYVISATDNQGCYVDSTITVGLDVNFTLSEVTTDETCGASDGAIDVTVTGGSNLTYSWDSGQITEDLTGLSAGTYTLTVTDDQLCSQSITSTVVNQTGAFSITSAVVNDENCQDATGSIDLTVTGTGPFTYAWSNGATTEDLTGLSAGTYTVDITDVGANCSLTETYVINNIASFTVAEVITEEFCTSQDGAIDLTITGGAMPFTFAWSNAAITEDLTGLDAGSYTVTITDNNGCQYTATYIVGQGSTGLQIVNIDITDETCGQGDGELDWGSGGTADDYFLDGNPIPFSQANNLSAGTYLVAATDNQGCYVDTLLTVGSAGTFTVDNVTSNETCGDANGSIDLTITGGNNVTFVWDNGATTEDLTGLTAGTYTVTISSTGPNCTIDQTFTVQNEVSYEMSATMTDDYCSSGIGAIDQEIVFGSNLTYLWDTGATTQDITGAVGGPHWCIVTDNNPGGCSDTIFYTLPNISNGTSISTSVIDEVCGDGTGAIDLTTTGGSGTFDYSWDSGQTTDDITGLSGGTYTVTVTDLGDNCVFTEVVVVDNIQTVFNGSGVVTDDACDQGIGAIDVTLSNATTYTYSWDSGQTTEDISGLSDGTYVLTATSAEGCDTVMTFVVNPTTNVFNITGTVTHATCATCNDGWINVTDPSNQNDYDWSTGATTQDISNLNPGQYTLIVTAPNGCDTTLVFDVLNTASLDELAALSISIDVLPNPATDNFTVNHVMPAGQKGEIIITDAVGKIVRRIDVAGEDAVTIDSRNFATGMYFVTLQSRKITKVKRVVVNRQ